MAKVRAYGADATLKMLPLSTPAEPSLLLTVIRRLPVAAVGEIEMFTVSDVALLNVVELTVIPVPENEVTVAPLR